MQCPPTQIPSCTPNPNKSSFMRQQTSICDVLRNCSATHSPPPKNIRHHFQTRILELCPDGLGCPDPRCGMQILMQIFTMPHAWQKAAKQRDQKKRCHRLSLQPETEPFPPHIPSHSQLACAKVHIGT